MKVKALISFCGPYTLTQGDVADIRDAALAERLIAAGYVSKLGKEKTTNDREDPEARHIPKRKHG